MGYGFGVFLVALGLILALAVRDAIPGVDLTMIGWILAGAGVVAVVLTAATALTRQRSVSRTVHSDGTQTTQEHRHNNPPPA